MFAGSFQKAFEWPEVSDVRDNKKALAQCGWVMGYSELTERRARHGGPIKNFENQENHEDQVNRSRWRHGRRAGPRRPHRRHRHRVGRLRRRSRTPLSLRARASCARRTQNLAEFQRTTSPAYNIDILAQRPDDRRPAANSGLGLADQLGTFQNSITGTAVSWTGRGRLTRHRSRRRARAAASDLFKSTGTCAQRRCPFSFVCA